jgi:hypothetical protein
MRRETDPDIGWVAALSHADLGRAKRAVDEAARETELFDHLAREHAREGRESYVEIDAPLELHALVRLTRPRHVVEVGVSSGVSSAYLLRALERNRQGTLHSIDRPARVGRRRRGSSREPRVSWTLPADRGSGWAVPSRLRSRWDLRLGDKKDLLPELAEELPRLDMFVYDVPHEERDAAREFRRLDPIAAPGAVVVVDHGPGGGLCSALRRWARACGEPARRRRGLGLYGMRHRSDLVHAGAVP